MPGKNWGKMAIQRLTSADGKIRRSSSVMAVFDELVMGKQFRAQVEIINQLKAIHSRVEAALVHFGINGSLAMTEEELREEELRRRRPPGFMTFKMKQEKLNKQRIMDSIHEFAQSCLSCERNMDEVNDWLYDVQVTLENNMVSEQLMEEQLVEITKLSEGYSDLYTEGKRLSRRHINRLRRVGKDIFQVLNELTREQDDDDDQDQQDESSHHVAMHPATKLHLRQQKAKKSQIPITDEANLKKIENWKSAAKDVEMSLDTACRLARTNQDRSTMRNAQKKFNFITGAMERRNQENSRLSQDILECEVKINHVTNLNEKIELESNKKSQRLEIAEVVVKKANDKIGDLQTKVKEAKKETVVVKNELMEVKATTNVDSSASILKVQELEKERDEALEKVSQLESEMQKMSDTHQTVIDEMKSKVADEQDTARKLERVVENLGAELREALKIQEEYAHQLDLAEYQKTDGKNQANSLREQYKTQIKDLKKDIDDLHREISNQKADLDSKEGTIEKQEQEILDLTRQVKEGQKTPKFKEVTTNEPSAKFKQRLSSIKGDYEQEINKLKDYLDKERNRNLAEKRRQEQDIKMQLGNIHKESVHLMRSINRFKESIASILEKEGLLDTAHEIKQMDNLVIDEKVTTDIRRVMNQMAGSATELLVSLELKIAQALMNKRIELKEALLHKQKAPGTPPTIEGGVELEKLQQENGQLHDRILKYQDQLNAAQVSFEEMKRINEEKYSALLERHKSQILHASNLQRELRSLDTTFREEIKKRDAKLRNMKVSAAKQERNQQVLVSRLNSVPEQPAPSLKRPNVEQMRMKVSDQMKNLNMLDEAFKENKISLELHTITVDIINQTIEVPEIRLRSLFERYIIFRKLQDQKKQLFNKISSEKKEQKGKDQQLTSFLERMEKRMTDSINKWRDKRENLKKQRTQLYEQLMAIFEVVSQEAGISMIRPCSVTFRPYKPPTRRRKVNLLQSAVHMEFPHAMKKESVIGTSMAFLREPGPFWRMPANWEASTALVTVPRMLDIDVNTTRKAAQDVLLRLGKGGDNRHHHGSRGKRAPSMPPIATMFPPISS